MGGRAAWKSGRPGISDYKIWIVMVGAGGRLQAHRGCLQIVNNRRTTTGGTRTKCPGSRISQRPKNRQLGV